MNFLKESRFSKEKIQNIIRNHLMYPLEATSKHINTKLIDYIEIKELEC